MINLFVEILKYSSNGNRIFVTNSFKNSVDPSNCNELNGARAPERSNYFNLTNSSGSSENN